MAMSFVNQNEWRIIGMSRSGNHAVINWLVSHTQGRSCFLNCAEPKHNPFTSARPLGNGPSHVANYEGFSFELECRGRFSRKEFLIYSHEDCFLGLMRNGPWEEQHDEWVGPSAERRDLLVLRDPYNLFASRLKAGIGEIPAATAMRIWKQHAREFAGIRRYLPNNPLMISYNRWFGEPDYRRQIARELGLTFTDAAFEEVCSTAGGSSFDGTRFRGRATRMRVFDRWKRFVDDADYRGLFDTEVHELSQSIFGRMPAAAEFDPSGTGALA